MRKNRYKIEQSVVTTIFEYDTENKSIYISTNEHDSPPMKWTHRHIREDLRTYSAHSIRVLSSLISSIFVCFFSISTVFHSERLGILFNYTFSSCQLDKIKRKKKHTISVHLKVHLTPYMCSIRRYSPHIAHTDTVCVKYTDFFPSIFSFIWLWFFLSQRFPYFVCFIWLEHDFKYLGTYITYNYTHWHRLIRLLSVCILFSPYHECRCHQIYTAKDRERKDTEKDKNNTQRQY